jgi:hypothetical protein
VSPRPLASEPARIVDTPYLNAKEAAAYLKFASVRALYKAISGGLDLPVLRRGKTLLFHRDQLDRWLAGEPRIGLLRELRSRAR